MAAAPGPCPARAQPVNQPAFTSTPDAPHRWAALTAAAGRSEQAAVQARLAEIPFGAAERGRVVAEARQLVAGCRRRVDERSLLDLFLQEFGLSNEEGVALLCISEALLRIPDHATAEALIAEKIATGNWASHLGRSESVFLNASTWALMLTGGVITLSEEVTGDLGRWASRWAGRVGEAVARAAMASAVRILAGEFVRGRTIEEALAKGAGELASYDMLGEGARTYEHAAQFRAAYSHAIDAVAAANETKAGPASGVSIKLSALHPRYEPLQRSRVHSELGEALLDLARQAAAAGVPCTVDAEEAERLELSLELFERLARHPDLRDWEGLGLAVQAYAPRAPAVIDWLAELRRPITVRLVKGAYWDAEIKRAQVEGLARYPVYTRKAFTDVAYIACAGRLLAAENLYPQFATHNAHTLAAVLALAKRASAAFEFQRLHGMGELLYDEARRRGLVGGDGAPQVRVYAPVGPHKDLLAYLVRRLLENGANTSFVNRFLDDAVPLGEVVRDPIVAASKDSTPHPRIPAPGALFAPVRDNSAGIDVGDRAAVADLVAAARAVVTPLIQTTAQVDVDALVGAAQRAFADWRDTPARARRRCLEQLADRLEKNRAGFVALLAREAGKTLADAVAEVREAVDFCRYYGAECTRLFAAPTTLPGPTGELNALSLHGRGVFACISPWNFPLAIFTGQVAAALAAGNTVVAAPAAQTPTIAAAAAELLVGCGFPADVLALAQGGPTAGAALVDHPQVAGVAFTGSTATAKRIERTLAAKNGPIVPFIAETGGQNAMVVDSTALLEQVVDDVVASAFRSAGQRCSALRVLYAQEEIADDLVAMLIGAMDALRIGHPEDPATDVGPVIDVRAWQRLETHVEAMRARILHRASLPPLGALNSHDLHGGARPSASRATIGMRGWRYFPPTLIELDSIAELEAEHFGPVLHFARFSAAKLSDVLGDIQRAGYGLTLGVHSRIQSRAEQVMAVVKAGNTYVNRDMVGAVVGVQPFGGEGYSGTGPKAGGPHYLPRFAVERTVTWNTVATGGNAELLRLPD